jgi:hypothetical protein
VRISLLSDPRVPGADEDAAGVLGDVVVVLDGAGLPARFRSGCRHSVAWYSHSLAARLLVRAQDRSLTLADALAAAIADVRALHEHECTLAEGSPSATVVAVRRDGDHLEHLVLCDASLLLVPRDGHVTRITDRRVEEVVREERDAEAIEARRNAPGGFWVARHEPEAAREALVGRVPLAELTRSVDLLGLHDDAALARDLARDPDTVVRRIRRAEEALDARRAPRKRHDDATVASLRL